MSLVAAHPPMPPSETGLPRPDLFDECAPRRRHVGWVVLAVIAVHLAVTVPLSAVLNLWIDEAFSLQTTSHGPRYALRAAVFHEAQPPSYFVLLSMWRWLNPSLFWARMFSVLMVAASIGLAARISSRVFPHIHPAWLAALLAASPLAVWAAMEVRCYAMVLLVATYLLCEFLDGYWLGEGSPAARLRYCVAAALGLTTQYYIGFLLVGCAAALFLGRRWRALGRYVLGMLAVAACFSPLALYVRGQVAAHTGSKPVIAGGGDAVQALSEAYWRLQDYTLPLAMRGEALTWATWMRDWLCRLAILVGVATLLARRWNDRQLGFISILAVQCLFFGALRWALGQDFFIYRYTISLLPAILVVVLSWADSLRLRSAVPACVLLMVALSASYVFAQQSRLAKNGDWHRVARHIESNERPGEPVLVFVNYAQLTLDASYHGRNVVRPIPRPWPTISTAPDACVVHDEAEVAAAFQAAMGRPGKFWLVVYGDRPFQGTNPHREFLDQYLERNATIEQSTPFWGTTVYYGDWHPGEVHAK